MISYKFYGIEIHHYLFVDAGTAVKGNSKHFNVVLSNAAYITLKSKQINSIIAVGMHGIVKTGEVNL
jgi:hypothetical protein